MEDQEWKTKQAKDPYKAENPCKAENQLTQTLTRDNEFL
jgi:hypothetical protein